MRVLVGVVFAAWLSACGPSWPSGALSVKAPHPDHAIATVDLLPLDLEMWAESGYADSPEQLRGNAEQTIVNAALDTLVKRSYSPNALIDWNGDYPGGGSALERKDLIATVGALARYGNAVATPNRLPVPYLPAHLGDKTGADATLYIGGWSYVANERPSTANEVAKDIAIGILVVATAALVIAAVSALDDKNSHSHAHSGGVGPIHHEDGASSGFSGVTVSHWHGHDESGSHALARAAVDVAANVAVDMVDAFGHEALVDATHPDYVEDASLPHQGGDPKMYLEMTLVDNHTGLALWHAHQTFPANGASQEDVARAAHTLLATMPAN